MNINDVKQFTQWPKEERLLFLALKTNVSKFDRSLYENNKIFRC